MKHNDILNRLYLRKNIVLFLMFFIMILLSGQLLWRELENNVWSTYFLKDLFLVSETNEKISLSPPSHHPVATLWLAWQSMGLNKEETCAFQPLLYPYVQANHPLAIRALGKCLTANGKPSEAVAVWSQYKDFQDLIGLGNNLLKEENTALALEAYQAAINLVPTKASTLRKVAFIYYSEGQFTLASEWYERAIRLGDPDSLLLIQFGNSLRDNGQPLNALSIYQQALAIDSDLPLAFFEMSHAYRLLDRPEDSIVAIEKALDLLVQPAVGYYLRAGSLYEWTGDCEVALAYFKQAATLASDNQQAKESILRLSSCNQSNETR